MARKLEKAKMVAILAAAVLSGCGDRSRLPAGCYYGEDGTAVLRIEGNRGVLLVPGQVKEVRLKWSRGSVRVTPAFYLVDLYRTETNDEGPSARFDYRLSPKPSIQLPFAPAAYVPATLGKSC